MVKWRLTHQKLKGQHSETPDINRNIVLNSLKNFRSSIIEGAAAGFPSFIAESSPPEIAQFTDTVWNYDILRFDIPMSNSIVVKVLKGWTDLG